MATWIPDSALKTAVKSVCGFNPTLAMATFWDELVRTGNIEGYNHIRRALIARDYSAASLESWCEKEPWNRTAGLYYTLSAANLDDDKITQQMDRLWERLLLLDSLTLIDTNGAVIDPGLLGGGAGPNIGYGTDVTSDDDRHSIDDVL